MENENNTLQIMKKLAVANITKAYSVRYVTNENVVIGHEGGCSIVDIKHGKEVEKISDLRCYKVAVHHHQKKILFSDGETIGLYNIEAHKTEWSILEEHIVKTIDFNTYDDTILFYLMHSSGPNDIIKKRDFLGNVCGDDVIIEKTTVNISNNVFCSEKQIMCVREQGVNVLSLYDASNLTLKPKQIVCSRSKHYISSEGNIAVKETDTNLITIIMNANRDDYTFVQLAGAMNDGLSQIFFYSKDSILLALLRGDDSNLKMRYWDVKTQQPICTVKFSCRHQFFPDFYFSPDGKEAIFVSSNECMTFPVPFEVRYYKDKTKERFPYMLFLLKKYIDRHQAVLDQDIPNDIRLLLAHTFFKTFER